MAKSDARIFKPKRWSRNDRYFGPFTWSYSDKYPHFAAILKSQGDEDDQPCYFRLTIGKATLITVLPPIIRPWREKVYPKWDADTIERLGRNWYWDIDLRQYGFSLNDGLLSLYYGRTGGACMDSSLQQQWSGFLPWTKWRRVRHSLYDADGAHFYTSAKSDGWEAREAAKDACPTVKFLIEDFDGEQIVATTRIEEREWLFGEGLFKWLSWFRKAKIIRRLDISFSKEVGPEKGSWKGGVVGTSIKMLPGEHHEPAFRRFCAEQHSAKHRQYGVTFLSRMEADGGRDG